MGDKSKIEWTDSTWNPIVGCSVVSPGCTNCYAMRMAARIEAMQGSAFDATEARKRSPYAGTTQPSKSGPVWTGKVSRASDDTLTEPLRWRKPRRIFVNSMGDLFHENVPDAWIDRVFAVMALAPQHTFQVLTKRSKRMREYMVASDRHGYVWRQTRFMSAPKMALEPRDQWPYVRHPATEWPLPNVWLGVSAEDQTRADERIPDLLATPAAVRFVSAEPLLEAIDFFHIGGGNYLNALSSSVGPNIDWIIVGGESGSGARPMHPDWARSIRDQCAAAGVAYFFKQWGEWIGVPDLRLLPGGGGPGFGAYDHCKHDMEAESVRVGKRTAGRMLDGAEHNGMPA